MSNEFAPIAVAIACTAALFFAPVSCREPRVVCATSCPSPSTPIPPGVVSADLQDGGPYDAGDGLPFEADQSPEALAAGTPTATACAKACAKLSKLGCPESRQLPGGRTCIETCREISAVSSFDPKCVYNASSTMIVRKCPQIKCNKAAP